ncbi:hypothetical protein MNBD_GAMMA15-2056 [hydrothermal vent metagenome]|uniref:Flagellar assembly protein FliH/Type III secretion system HrpE domain-containing protein n=1 Tax=hydrothermal vent metagenome TaxID=652676 RepID=A0A3B0YSU7_9ZZZZ
MSKIIRADDLQDCEAWHVPEVGAGSRETRPMTARQLEEIHEQARQEGLERGIKEGREQGAREFAEHIQSLKQLVATLDKPLEELDESIEQQLAQLSMIVARQLVRRELKTEPEQVIGVVRDALTALPLAARNVRLSLHPDDAVLVNKALSLQEGEASIHIVEDPVQTRGGCRVLTDSSQIDATVESRLNAIIAKTLGGLRSSDEDETES